LIGLASIITIAVLLQRPVDRVLILGACGFALFTLAWTGMFFRLKRELPEHALVDATYLQPSHRFRRPAPHRVPQYVRPHTVPLRTSPYRPVVDAVDRRPGEACGVAHRLCALRAVDTRAHVYDESIDTRHDDTAGEAWLHGCFSYMWYRRSSKSE
jgi:hypothetical protein